MRCEAHAKVRFRLWKCHLECLSAQRYRTGICVWVVGALCRVPPVHVQKSIVFMLVLAKKKENKMLCKGDFTLFDPANPSANRNDNFFRGCAPSTERFGVTVRCRTVVAFENFYVYDKEMMAIKKNPHHCRHPQRPCTTFEYFHLESHRNSFSNPNCNSYARRCSKNYERKKKEGLRERIAKWDHFTWSGDWALCALNTRSHTSFSSCWINAKHFLQTFSSSLCFCKIHWHWSADVLRVHANVERWCRAPACAHAAQRAWYAAFSAVAFLMKI